MIGYFGTSNTIKCKICSERIPTDAKTAHLDEWRDPKTILSSIEQRNLGKIKKAFDHGADVNYRFADKEQKSEENIFLKLEYLSYFNQEVICILR